MAESANAPSSTRLVSASVGWAALPYDLIVQHLGPSLDSTSLPQARLVCRSWALGFAGACKSVKARGQPPPGWGKTFSQIAELHWSPLLRGEEENLRHLKTLETPDDNVCRGCRLACSLRATLAVPAWHTISTPYQILSQAYYSCRLRSHQLGPEQMQEDH